MPQQVLDPSNIGTPAAVKEAPTTLPQSVRRFGHIPNFDFWHPGDLLLFCSQRPNPMQRQIVRTQISLKYGDDHARWHHAAIYIGDSYLCEARPGGVRYHAVVEFVPHMLIRVRRNAALTESQRFRIAIRALMRLTRPYSYRSTARAWLRSWRRGQFTLARRARNRAVICSQLFHDAYMEATGRTLVQRADVDVLPAELSACSGLSDVSTGWARLPP